VPKNYKDTGVRVADAQFAKAAVRLADSFDHIMGCPTVACPRT
jgi:hypothetical protein